MEFLKRAHDVFPGAWGFSIAPGEVIACSLCHPCACGGCRAAPGSVRNCDRCTCYDDRD
ncbi:hypothetical protein AB0I84_36965 [Streptomyces spectabilis]|uniref:hypothetical protein n=1 Tax=Streptomyces spectabilis TaxID=68270 RepID=UPI0033E41E80